MNQIIFHLTVILTIILYLCVKLSCAFHRFTGQPSGPSLGQLGPPPPLLGEAHQQTFEHSGSGSYWFINHFYKRISHLQKCHCFLVSFDVSATAYNQN